MLSPKSGPNTIPIVERTNKAPFIMLHHIKNLVSFCISMLILLCLSHFEKPKMADCIFLIPPRDTGVTFI
jgi:hypothetical protein